MKKLLSLMLVLTFALSLTATAASRIGTRSHDTGGAGFYILGQTANMHDTGGAGAPEIRK